MIRDRMDVAVASACLDRTPLRSCQLARSTAQTYNHIDSHEHSREVEDSDVRAVQSVSPDDHVAASGAGSLPNP